MAGALLFAVVALVCAAAKTAKKSAVDRRRSVIPP
jgi:hypothetical protein